MALVLKLKIGLIGVLLLLGIEATLTWYLVSCDIHLALPILSGLIAVPTIFIGCFLRDIISQSPAESHTVRSLLSQYAYSLLSRTVGKLAWRKFQKKSRCCSKLQENLLKYILEKNSKTKYAKDARLSAAEMQSVEQFIKKHPITTYEDYRPYIEKIMKGESNVLTKDDPYFIATTSGTTGASKRFPIIKETKKKIVSAALAMMYSHKAVFAPLKRIWQFRIMSKPSYAENGLLVTVFSNVLAVPHKYNIVPDVITKIYTEYPAFYVQAIFALTEPELFYIDGFSSNLIYTFFKFLESNYVQICHDIATGQIGHVDLDPKIKDEINSLMAPNPKRAAFIQRQVELGPSGLARRIWPDLKYVHMATSASMKMCADMLSKSYFDGVQIFQIGHGASEAFLGYQLENELESEVLTLIPEGTTFMEFVPLESCHESQPATVLMHKLEVGQQYEIVVTTINGLYRLRFGDIIEVVGYYNNVPKYILKGRLGQQLNIAYERTPENLFYKALCSAEKLTELPKIEDYTATESIALEKITGKSQPESYYVVFLEFPADSCVTKEAMNHFQKQLEECLCESHPSYRITKQKGHLVSAQVIEVKSGTFDKLRYKIYGESHNMQFKMPRVIRRTELLQLLWDCRRSAAETFVETLSNDTTAEKYVTVRL